MSIRSYIRTALILTLAGVLFSGYISAVKLFSNTCAFNESCPYFLGYPACWYGFGLFLIMFVVTILSLLSTIRASAVLKINTIVSFVGILFAGNFALKEIAQSQATGVLGLSTCIYGLIFFIIIFVVSLSVRKQS